MSNWINFEIKNRKYYLLFKINEENCDCILYDGSESWHENEKLEAILARVKAQNRRIQFDELTIRETLQNGQPAEANWIEAQNDEDEAECPTKSLKLKYSVKSCPFHFTWQLNKQSEHDFQKFILFPLFRIVQGFTQQNQELREVIRKKDIEIKQYKYEFGTLKRATVATQAFNAADFDERFAETLELSRCMLQISDLLKAQYSQMKTPLKAKAVDKVDDDDVGATKANDVKLTPRRKRRKVIEEQQRIIAEKMQALSKPFAYESSQSQVSSHSDNEAASTSKRLLRSPKKSAELKIENDLDETPTKKNRTQKPVSDQSPVKLPKRNLNAGVEYDDSSEDDTKTNKMRSRSLAEVANDIKTTEKDEKKVENPTPTTRNSPRLTGDKSPTKLSKISTDNNATAVSLSRSADVFEFSDSADHEMKASKSASQNLQQLSKETIVTNKTDQTTKLRSNGPVVKIAKLTPVKLPKGTSNTSPPVAGRLTKKNAGIEYEDSSESPELTCNKSSSSNATPTKDSNSKTTQSPEQLSDDVQSIIDEWKALEKRRLADLKVKGK